MHLGYVNPSGNYLLEIDDRVEIEPVHEQAWVSYVLGVIFDQKLKFNKNIAACQ
jgi:hypothetical protein